MTKRRLGGNIQKNEREQIMKLQDTVTVTPIHEIESLFDSENRIFFKRDVLLPFSFGGNKVRIAKNIITDMQKKGCDTLITYGNKRSNLCRVTTNMARALNIPCYMISVIDDDHGDSRAFNGEMAQLFKAKVIKCAKSEVDLVVAELKARIVSEGGKPYFINDGAAVINQASTYISVYDEILKQSEAFGGFDYIYCASGSGTTQAGLIAGRILSKNEKAPLVVGISTARVKERGVMKLKEHLTGLSEMGYDIPREEIDKNVILATEYLCGGYSLCTDEIKQACRDMLSVNGLELDPTYTGKAYVGMEKHLKDNGIRGKNILFIHTGGLPLFFDLLNEDA